MNWVTLKLSLPPSTKTTIQPSRSSTIVDLLIAIVMCISGILRYSIHALWRTSCWFTFLESWSQPMCLRRLSDGSFTIVTPPASWGTMAILAGNLSWYYFQLLFPPRQYAFYWFLSLTISIGVILDFFLAGPFFPAVMRYFSHQGRVSAGQLCDLRMSETHARCDTNGYLRFTHDHGRCNGIEMISRDSLNKSSLFRYFILCVVWLD